MTHSKIFTLSNINPRAFYNREKMEGNELKDNRNEESEENPIVEILGHKIELPTHFEICKFIREICLKVKAHPKVTATALLVYHRIYDYEQMVSFKVFSYNYNDNKIRLLSKS